MAARIERATPDADCFNHEAELPYELRLADFELAMQDIYDLLSDINTALMTRGLMRLEEIVRPAIFSGILSDALTASVARHSRVLTENQYHNGHPDLIPKGRYANDRVAAGEDGVEVKATKGKGAVDTHGARDSWIVIFRYRVDGETEPVMERLPTRITEVLLANLTKDDFRKNPRGELGTKTASPNRQGLVKLRGNWVYREA
ncbi:MAG: hypothetical protein WD739_11100 [Actinomycetota bacterium]